MIASQDGLVETDIAGLTSEGAGVGRMPDGRALFVHRTAPGDRVSAEIMVARDRWARGRLREVLLESPDRQTPPCELYDRCGGCVVQHMTPEAQVRAKIARVEAALRRIGGLEALPTARAHAAPSQTRYRNRVTFTLRRLGGGRVVAGFHRLERPDRLLDVDGRCLLPELPVVQAWEELRSAWGDGARWLPAGSRLRLTLRGSAGGEVLLYVEDGNGDGRPDEILSRAPRIAAVWRRSARDREPRLVAGRGDLVESWYGEDVPADPRCFLQPNRMGAASLHDTVLDALGPMEGRRVVDAYCGFGVYGRVLAGRGARTVGIESDAGAVSVGRARPVPGFQLIEGRVEDHIGEALPAHAVILNPPRAGVAGGVMDRLAESTVSSIVYVSCDPATLARDIARLGTGYRLEALHVFDLFPMTAHVETIAVLVREGGAVDGVFE